MADHADVSVRPARPDDADALARVQVTTWRAAYAGILPPHALDALTKEAAATAWRAAITAPPSPRHRVLVAIDAGSVVGYAAMAPATDEDRDPAADGELLVLYVEPAAGRRGHGSRLLAAVVDTLREGHCQYAHTWLLARDDVTRAFLTAAGWAPDGATRDLDMGELVHQVRLHTDLRTDA